MVSGRVERGNSRVGVVSVPLKATSSDLNRVPKKDIIQREEDHEM